MAQTAQQRREAARELAAKIFPPTVTATLNLDDLTAAVGSIDDTMDALPGALTGGQTIKQNFLSRLPEPFKSTATAQQKAVALVAWALKESGLI